MKTKQEQYATTVSMVNYHFVFCPRYRRRVFLIDGLEARFRELVAQICEQNGIDILSMECQPDHCRLYVHAPPTLGPSDIMRIIKRQTASTLKKEYLPGKYLQLWTRGFFVSSAGELPENLVQEYIQSQKTRGV